MGKGKRKKEVDEHHEEISKALSVKGASDRAVWQLWNIFKPEEQSMSRGTFLRNVDQHLGAWKEVTRPVAFKRHDGSQLVLPIVELEPCLQKLCRESAALTAAFRRALGGNPTLTPLVYADECTPGNVLSVTKSRKACLFYLSWREMWHGLKNPNSWVPVAAIQSSAIASLEGGVSAVVVALLKYLISDTDPPGIELAPGLFFRQHSAAWYVGDYESIRGVFSLKGSAGLRPCLWCSNVVKKDSGLPEQDGWFRDITASSGFEKVHADEIWAIARKMAEPCSKKDLKGQEVTSGIVFNTHSLLWSDQKEKMVPERILYDTMHSYYSNGCASWEIALLLQAIYTRTNVTREVLQEAVLACQWKSLKSGGKTQTYIRALFDEKICNEELFKGQAHQTAAIVPLMWYYMETLLLRSLSVEEIKSFRGMGSIVAFIREKYHELKTLDTESLNTFDRLQKLHHYWFVKAYPASCKPKHHHRLHLAEQWKAFQIIVSCEALESKHRLYKAGIGERQRSLTNDPTSFSASCLSRLLHVSCSELIEQGLPFWELLKPIEDACLDDKIAFTTQNLKTSKRVSVGPSYLCVKKRCARYTYFKIHPSNLEFDILRLFLFILLNYIQEKYFSTTSIFFHQAATWSHAVSRRTTLYCGLLSAASSFGGFTATNWVCMCG